MCCGRTRCCRWQRRDSCSPEYDSAGTRRRASPSSRKAASTGTEPRRLYRGMVFHQGHVITAERHHKQHRPDVLEATDPLSALSPLASNVVHPTHTHTKGENLTTNRQPITPIFAEEELDRDSVFATWQLLHIRALAHNLRDLMEHRGGTHCWGDPMEDGVYLKEKPQRSNTCLSVI